MGFMRSKAFNIALCVLQGMVFLVAALVTVTHINPSDCVALIVLTAAIALPIIVTAYYLCSISCGSNVKIIIPYAEFAKYYTLNPDRYELRNGFVVAKRGGGYIGMYIGFTFYGFFRYLFFYLCAKRTEKYKKCNRNYVQYLELVQKDIDTLKEQANKETKEAGIILTKIDGGNVQ